MPNMSGLHLVRQLRQSAGPSASLPVIVYSAAAREGADEWTDARLEAITSNASPETLLQEIERITGGADAAADDSGR